MSLPVAWLSLPAARLPAERLDNEAVIARIRARFRGSDAEWEHLVRLLRYLFRLCGTRERYLFSSPEEVYQSGVAAIRDVLGEQGRRPEEVDLLVYGAIAREYLEPATAAEIGARLGLPRTLAFDVSAACASGLLGVQDVLARFALEPELRLGVVFTLSATIDHLSFDLTSPESIDTLGAGLTIGNACTAMLVSRDPPRVGGRVVAIQAQSFSEHHEVCRAPVNGPFQSRSAELFAAMREHVPGHLRRTAERAGWEMGEVDLWVLHQASDRILRELAERMGVDLARVPRLHGVYGNTDASSAPLTLRWLHEQGRVKPGMKVVVGSGAAGILLASAALAWGE